MLSEPMIVRKLWRQADQFEKLAEVFTHLKKPEMAKVCKQLAEVCMMLSDLFSRKKGPEVGEHASPARKAQEARRLMSREREKRAPTKNG